MNGKPIITACVVATSCGISDVPSQWKGQNFTVYWLHYSYDSHRNMLT